MGASESATRRVDLTSFVELLASLLVTWGADGADELRSRVSAMLAEVTDRELAALQERLASTGSDWSYYPADPVARHISRTVTARLLGDASGVENGGALDSGRGGPLVLAGNHLSYVDVNVLDALVSATGYGDVAARVTTLVGPKVFTEPERRLASLCFGTLKLPQSTSRASGEAVMGAREVARLARKTIAMARERQDRGDHLLLFPEGTRSRDSRMGPCLASVARYFEHPGSQLLPWAHTGCEKLRPVGDERCHEADVRIRFGRPIPVSELQRACGRSRQRLADVVGFLIADLLPEGYRGHYGSPAPERAVARDLADAFSR